MESTPRPTISVENLNVNIRHWPENRGNVIYSRGERFCFRLGPCDGYWKWPWPEWIGIPDRTNVKEWTKLMDGWMMLVMDPSKRDTVEEHIGKLLPYL